MKAIKKTNEVTPIEGGRPVKTIETMLRITASNNQKLSDQADKKAHIMISVNAIILSMIISLCYQHTQTITLAFLPIALLIFINLLTIIFTILSTRPAIPKGSFTQQELLTKKTNPLFFGNYYNIPFETYCNSMLLVMNDQQYVYQSLLKDNYCQGLVLAKKYKYLRIAYNIFMPGLALAAVLYLIITLLF